MKSSLSLDDVLEDSPQTRCLVNVFEQDAARVHDYMNGVQFALNDLANAQRNITDAMQKLGDVFNQYGSQNFPLEHSDTEFPAVVDKFQRTVNELSSWMEVVSQQLTNCVVYPVEKFIREMNELQGRKDVFHSIADELDTSILKHAKIGRKDAPKKLEESNEELCSVRRRFHLAGLRYYVQLNNLQFTRRIALLEPVLTLLYAFRSFFHVGHQSLSNDKELGDFFTRTQEQLQSLHSEQDNETRKSEEFIRTVNEIERLQPDIYNVELRSLIDGDRNISHKQGYLYLKSKSTLMSKWERHYFFTQIGSLMCQARNELAGQLLVELAQGVHAAVADNEDRRHTFIIHCPKSKRQFILQASNERDRDEWINAINNLIEESSPNSAQSNVISAKNEQHQQQRPEKVEGNRKSKEDATPIFTAPIQFDMLTPVDDTPPSTESDVGDAPAFSYTLKFLGSMEVSTDRDERTAHDAIRQILSARDVHKISNTFNVKLVVSRGELRLLDPESVGTRAAFNLEDLALWTTDPNNKNILAFIVRTKGGKADGRHKFTSYVFECSDKSIIDDICGRFYDATKSAFQAMIDKNSSPNEVPTEIKEKNIVETNVIKNELSSNAATVDDGSKSDEQQNLPKPDE